MNKIFRVIWSVLRGQYIVVSEASQTRGKERAARTESASEEKEEEGAAAHALRLSAVAAAVMAAGLAAPAANAASVTRGGEAVELDADGAFGWDDLKLDGFTKTQAEHDLAFDAYRWDEHKDENGETLPGQDQTVHVNAASSDDAPAVLEAEDWSAVASGNPGSQGSITASDVLEDGGSAVITTGSDESKTVYSQEDFQEALSPEFSLGSTSSVTYEDEVTGADRTANVWLPYGEEDVEGETSTKGFHETPYAGEETFAKPQKSDFYDENGNRLGSGQYVDKTFFQVGKDAELQVQVGSGHFEDFHAILKVSGSDKRSTVFEAVDGGQITYKSKTNVQLAKDSDSAGSGNSIGWTHETISFKNKKVEALDTLVYTKTVMADDGTEQVTSQTLKRYELTEKKKAELEADGFRCSQTTQFVVDSVADLKEFNSYLISLLGQKKPNEEEGSYDEAWYQEEFQSAFEIVTQSWTAKFPETADYFIPSADSTAKASTQQQVSFLRAGKTENGEENGRVVVAEGAEIVLQNSVASLLRVDGSTDAAQTEIGSAANAEAVIESGGRLAVEGSYGWAVNAHGGKVWNEGEIDAGAQNSDAYSFVGVHLEDHARFENKKGALVQYANSPFGKAAEVTGGSVFSNEGVVNVATGAIRAPNTSDPYGIRVDRTSLIDVEGEGSRFENQEGGLIFAGGQNVSQEDMKNLDADGIKELLGKNNNFESYEQPVDIVSVGSGGAFVNAGEIATGAGFRNLNVVRLEAGASFVNEETGVISLNGGLFENGEQGLNAAVEALAGSTAVNKGTINLNGVNTVALYAAEKEEGAVADETPRVVNEGTIVVGEATEGGAPNYAIWAEGDGTKAENAGTIELAGDRAIGIHARSGADIDVTGNAKIVFDSAKQNATGQIAYLIYGAGEDGQATTIRDTSSGASSEGAHKVTADYSTYFRVDTGATLDLTSGFYDVASQGSSIITVTGEGAAFTAKNQEADKLHFTVSGDNSSALLVTGGGYGFWDGNIDLTITGQDAAIAVISGEYISVETNQADPTRFATSYFDNNANITGDTFEDGAVAFRVESGGVLRNQGSIDFAAGSGEEESEPKTFTGVVLDGGTLMNGWDENGSLIEDAKAKISVNGIAVEVRGTGEGGGQSVLQNAGTIEATDGTAAVYLRDNASLTLTEAEKGVITAGGTAHAILLGESAGTLTLDGAKLEMKASEEGKVSTGSAIENFSGKEVVVNSADITVVDGIGIHSEKIAFGESAAGKDPTKISISGNGTGIVQAKYDKENDEWTATSENLSFNSEVTVVGAALNDEDQDYRGTGIEAATTGDVAVNGDLTGLNVGLLAGASESSVDSITVGKDAFIQVGADAGDQPAAGVKLAADEVAFLTVEGTIEAYAAEGAEGAGIDFSSEGDSTKKIGSTTISGKIAAAGAADGIDFSGSLLTDGLTVAEGGAVSAASGAAIRLDGASGEGSNGLVFSNSGSVSVESGIAVSLNGLKSAAQITNAGTISAQSGKGISGSGLMHSVAVTNSGTISGGIALENASGNAGHTVTLARGSNLSDGVALSTGDDQVRVAGVADSIATGAGDDSVYIEGNAASAGEVQLGAGDDVLTLEGVNSEAAGKVFSTAEAGEDYDVLKLDDSQASVDTVRAKQIRNFERIELMNASALTFKGDEALFLNVNDDDPSVGNDGYQAQVQIEHLSTLALTGADASDDFNLGYTLAGSGTLKVSDMKEFAFNYGEANDQAADWTGANFTGTFELADAKANLDGQTARALQSSMAVLQSGGVLTAGRFYDDEEGVGWSELAGLDFEGGTLRWDESANIRAAASSLDRVVYFTDSDRRILVGSESPDDPAAVINFTNGGKISVTLNRKAADESLETDANVRRAYTLMEQDEGSVDVQLVYAPNAKFEGSIDDIDFVMFDEEGKELTPKDLEVELDGQTATAYYNYGLTTSSLGYGHAGGSSGAEGRDDGIYVAKLLDRLHLHSTEADSLMTLSGVSNSESVRGNEFHALLFGEGGFAFKGLNDVNDGGKAYINGDGNAYAGPTVIENGTLVAAVTNALGGRTFCEDEKGKDYYEFSGDYTSEVRIATGATLQLGLSRDEAAAAGEERKAVTQTIGWLDADFNSTLDLGISTLTLNPKEESELGYHRLSSLIGESGARLEIQAGKLLVDAHNASYHGTVYVGEGASAVIQNPFGYALGDNVIELGAGDNASTLVVDMTNGAGFQFGAAVKSLQGDDNGLIIVRNDLGQTEFKFAEATKDKKSAQKDGDFTGTLSLYNASYDFHVQSNRTMSAAGLQVRDGSKVVVSGVSKLGTLSLGQSGDDGEAVFNFGELALGSAANVNVIDLKKTLSSGDGMAFNGITADFVVDTNESGMASGGKAIQENADDGSVADGRLSLLDQDEEGVFTALVLNAFKTGESVPSTHNLSDLTLTGSNSDVVTGAAVDLYRGDLNDDSHIATAFYELAGAGDGKGGKLVEKDGDIGVTSQLVELRIEDGEAVTFDDVLGSTQSNDFKALITESGALNGGGSIVIAPIAAKAEGLEHPTEVVISNGENRFSGMTTVLDGAHLTLGADNALGSSIQTTAGPMGRTSAVHLKGSGVFDLDGHSQSVGAVVSEKDGGGQLHSQIDLGQSGNLTIEGLQASSVGQMAGTGALALWKSSLTIANAAAEGTAIGYAVGIAGEGNSGSSADLIIQDAAALGTGLVQLNETSSLIVSNSAAGTLANEIDGTGSVTFEGQGAVTMVREGDDEEKKNDFSGGLTVTNGAQVIAGSETKEGSDYIGTGALHLENGSLTVHTQQGWIPNRQLVDGSGTLAVVKHGKQQQSFVFAEGQDSSDSEYNFSGTLDLTNVRIGFTDAEGNNANVLKDATLVLNNRAAADFNAEDVSFSGFEAQGQDVLLDFSAIENAFAANGDAENVFTASSIIFGANSSGTVRVDLSNVENVASDTDSAVGEMQTLPLLDQDNGDILFYLGKVTKGGKLSGSLANYELQLKNGEEWSDPDNPYRAGITQDEKEVATGYYELGLGMDTKGFGVSFGLSEIWIYGGETLELSAGTDNTLSARLTEHARTPEEVSDDKPEGTGSIRVLDGQTVRLANSGNDLTGTAAVGENATLILAAEHTLGGGEYNGKDTGYISQVDLTQSGAKLQLGEGNTGVNQTVGSVTVGEGASIELSADSVLAIAGKSSHAAQEQTLADNVVEGHIYGGSEAELQILNGTHLVVNTADNVSGDKETSFKTSVGEGSSLALDNAKSLGDGIIKLDASTVSDTANGRLLIKASDDWTMENVLAGGGDVIFTAAEGLTSQPALWLKAADAGMFTGTLALTNAAFSLSADAADQANDRGAYVNGKAMEQASIIALRSRLDIDGGENKLANLTLEDSVLAVGSAEWNSTGESYSSGWLHLSGTLNLQGENTVELDGLGNIDAFNLLDQDDGVVVTIVKADKGLAAGSQETVNAVFTSENASVGYVIQAIEEGVRGKYGVDDKILTAHDDDKGLFLATKLLEAEVDAGATLTLENEDAETDSPSASFSASITGAGGLTIAANSTVTLDHETPKAEAGEEDFVTDFTGETTVMGNAELRLKTDGSLGTAESHTSGVTLNDSASLYVFQDTKQYAGGLTTASSSTVTLEAGSALYLYDMSNIAAHPVSDEGANDSGALYGTGDLHFVSGTHRIHGVNANYGNAQEGNDSGDQAMVYIAAEKDPSESGEAQRAAEVDLYDVNALGVAEIVLGDTGTLAFMPEDGAELAGTFDNKISGSGVVTAYSDADVTIDALGTSEASGFSGVFHAQSGGTITLQGAEEFGGAAGDVDAGGTLALRVDDESYESEWMLENVVSGAGTFIVDLNKKFSLDSLEQDGSGADGTPAADDYDSLLGNNQLRISDEVADAMSEDFVGTLRLEEASLNVAGNAEKALNQGTLEVATDSFALVSEEGRTETEEGGHPYHSIGGLAFAENKDEAGAIRFGRTDAVEIGETDQQPLLKVNDLDASGYGTVQVVIDDKAYASPTSAESLQNQYASLLDQDDGDLQAQLVRAEDVADGSAANLTVNFVAQEDPESQGGSGSIEPPHPTEDEALSDLEMDAVAWIYQNSAELDALQRDESTDSAESEDPVAVGHYGYKLTVNREENEDKGLWLTYGLKQVDIKDGATLVLVEGDAESNPSGANDFSAKITEHQYNADLTRNEAADSDAVGHVLVAGDVVLSNGENVYKGVTTVEQDSTLTAGASGALGQSGEDEHTSHLVLKKNAGFSLAGHEQTIGRLTAGDGAFVSLSGSIAGTETYAAREGSQAVLTIDNGGSTSSADALRGDGTIVLKGGVLTVDSYNHNLSGEIILGTVDAQEADPPADADESGITAANAAMTLDEAPDAQTDNAFNGEIPPAVVINDAKGLGNVDVTFSDSTEGEAVLYMNGVNSAETGTFSNELKGKGYVRMSGSDVIIGDATDNTAFTGVWQLGTGAGYSEDETGNAFLDENAEVTASTATFTSFRSLGDDSASFELGVGSTLKLALSNDFGNEASRLFEQAISGAGDVEVDVGAGNVLVLDNTFAHTGLTDVISGGIKSVGDEAPAAGEEDEEAAEGAESEAAEGSVSEAASGEESAGGEASSGEATTAQTERTTLASDVNLRSGTFMEGFKEVGSVTNGGTIFVNWQRYANEGASGKTTTVYTKEIANELTINGDYKGEGGTLVFNGALAGDDSPVDTIVVTGDASGTGKVQVHNLGGTGALTSAHGITLMTIDGTSTLELSQDGRIVAGAYDYVLLRDPDSRRFYLQSTAGEYPIPPTAPVGPLVRPEAGAYMAASLAANWAEMRLHDRAGESHYVDPLTGEVKETSVWLRQVATHGHFRSAGEQLRTHMTGGVTQLGGDIIRRNGEGDVRGNIGLFGTALYGKSTTKSAISSHWADTRSDGYAAGVYATIFNGQGETLDGGGYLDLWAQYAWLDHEIRPKELATEKYDADGWIASIEAGWTFQLGSTDRGGAHQVDWSLQPQAQAIYEGVKSDEHVEAEGTRVRMTGEGNIKTRLGFRLQASPKAEPDERRGQAFLELNWIHNTKTLGVEMNGVKIESEGMKDAGEVRFGFEGELTESLHGWINGGYLAGGHGHHEETLNIGVKYLW